MSDDYLTLKELAEMLKLAERTVYRHAQNGELPGFKVGGSWRFRRSDIEEWMSRRIEEARREAATRRGNLGPEGASRA